RTQFKAVDGRPGFLNYIVDHVEFLALTGNLARAVRIAERHLQMVLAYPAPSVRRAWFRTPRFLCAVLAEAGRKNGQVRFPHGHAMKTPDDRVTPDALLAHFDREARAVAAAFDARDGHTQHTDAIDGQSMMLKLVHQYPISPRRRPDPEDVS